MLTEIGMMDKCNAVRTEFKIRPLQLGHSIPRSRKGRLSSSVNTPTARQHR
jgi:hypothetical protein